MPRRVGHFSAALPRREHWSSSAAARALRVQAGRSSEGEEDVAPAEDLMREHGGLNRILLIYDDSVRRIDAHALFRADVLAEAAGIVERFIEGYHEKLEEEFLFPRFEERGRLVELVTVLRTQHERGPRPRRGSASSPPRPTAAVATAWPSRCGLHAHVPAARGARGTVLFPAFEQLVSRKEYEALGERFEDREHELFGARGSRAS